MSCARRIAAHGSLATERFVYEPYDVSRWNASTYPGVGESFGMTFHSPEYVGERWGEVFEFLKLLPRAIGGWQDLVVLRRRPGD